MNEYERCNTQDLVIYLDMWIWNRVQVMFSHDAFLFDKYQTKCDMIKSELLSRAKKEDEGAMLYLFEALEIAIQNKYAAANCPEKWEQYDTECEEYKKEIVSLLT